MIFVKLQVDVVKPFWPGPQFFGHLSKPSYQSGYVVFSKKGGLEKTRKWLWDATSMDQKRVPQKPYRYKEK